MDLSFFSQFLIIFLFFLIFSSTVNIKIESQGLNNINTKKVLFLLCFVYVIPFLFTLLIHSLYSNIITQSLLLLNLSPPAIIILPLLFMWGFKDTNVLITFFISYVISSIILQLFFNVNLLDFIVFFTGACILPFILAFYFNNCFSMKLKKSFNTISDILLFMIFSVSLSISKSQLININPPLIFILILRNMLIPTFLFFSLRYFKFPISLAVGATLFTFLKNSSLAIVLAINLFQNLNLTLIPLLSPFFEVIFLLLFSIIINNIKNTTENPKLRLINNL